MEAQSNNRRYDAFTPFTRRLARALLRSSREKRSRSLADAHSAANVSDRSRLNTGNLIVRETILGD